MSASVMGAVLAACGGANSTGGSGDQRDGSAASSTSRAATKGGTLKLAAQAPSAAINPLTVADAGGLVHARPDRRVPDLRQQHQAPAASRCWRPAGRHNGDGTVWTFKLRTGVKFHNGQPMTADDVVYTFQQLADPKNASNALSTFSGVLKPDGRRARSTPARSRSTSRRRTATSPTSSPPTTTTRSSSPRAPTSASGARRSIGTGPFKLKSYTAEPGRRLRRQPRLLGRRPEPRRRPRSAFYAVPAAADPGAAGRRRRRDRAVRAARAPRRCSNNASQYTIIKLKSSNHRELSMRTDQAPFTDPRVRQAIALLARPPGDGAGAAAGLRRGRQRQPVRAEVPVDEHERAAARPRTSPRPSSCCRRPATPSFSATLATEQYEEIPQLAQVIQQSATKIGVNINLKVETQTAYYGKATFGNSDWLDAHDVARRLRRPRRAQRVPGVAAGHRRPVERRPLQQQDTTTSWSSSTSPRSTSRPRSTIAGKIETLLLARDAARHPVLHRRPDRVDAEGHGAQPDVDRRRSSSRTRRSAPERRQRPTGRPCHVAHAVHPQADRARDHHAVHPEPDRVLRRAGAAGRPRPGDPRAAGGAVGGQARSSQQLGTDKPVLDAVRHLARAHRARQLRHLVPSTRRPIGPILGKALVQLARSWRRWRS